MNSPPNRAADEADGTATVWELPHAPSPPRDPSPVDGPGGQRSSPDHPDASSTPGERPGDRWGEGPSCRTVMDGGVRGSEACRQFSYDDEASGSSGAGGDSAAATPAESGPAGRGPPSAAGDGDRDRDAKERPGGGNDEGRAAAGAVHVPEPAPNLVRSAFRGRQRRSLARRERAASRTGIGAEGGSEPQANGGRDRQGRQASGGEDGSGSGPQDSDASLGLSTSSAEPRRPCDFEQSFGSRSSTFSVSNVGCPNGNGGRNGPTPSRRDLFARSRSSAAVLGPGSLSTLSRSSRGSRNLLGMRRSVRNLNLEADVRAAEQTSEGLVSATLVDEEDVVVARVVEEEAESEVERIVRRLERRNERRIPVTAAVKTRFLRLCRDAQPRSSSAGRPTAAPAATTGGAKWDSSCILRDDVLRIRKAVRLEVEGRTRARRVLDGTLAWLGFRCQCKVLLSVLNRAVDAIDRRGGGAATRSRASDLDAGATGATCSGDRRGSFVSLASLQSMERGEGRRAPQSTADGANDRDDGNGVGGVGTTVDDEADLFHFNDFTFYNLEQVSRYPWMRSAGVFSVLATLAFYLFSPLLWCAVMDDPNVCPANENGQSGWLASLYFASATMSTVGYGDVTVLKGTGNVDGWRIFVATLYMVVSLVVSVVALQFGLDSKFSPFRRRFDQFCSRVLEIVQRARPTEDKLVDITRRMRWAKYAQIAEILTVFLILNLIGMFAVQIALLTPSGQGMTISWTESFYWAVQTTTTIGYGDVDIPDSLRWFMLVYLILATYFVGSSLGKLRELSSKQESMQQLFLWQQQEPSYSMLSDFSGRPSDGIDKTTGECMTRNPEINQFEFTIASLVLLGKITSEDVRPILKKFESLSGNSNKITLCEEDGVTDEEESGNESDEQDDLDVNATEEQVGTYPQQQRRQTSGALSLGKEIVKAFREEILTSSVIDQDRTGSDISLDDSMESQPDYSHFRVPSNTHAIAIDDSKIQRKLMGKYFEFCGIPVGRTTIVGDTYNEIMGFEDFVVNFIITHPDDFVLMVVDENLDVAQTNSCGNFMTLSGSLCVENIRKRLPTQLERRLFALIRSANDSTTDIAIYESRAHGFLPKQPVKKDKVLDVLAPLWTNRFPPALFGETFGHSSKSGLETISEGVAGATTVDINQKMTYIQSLFEKKEASELHLIHDQMHELKGDLLTLDTNMSVTSVIGNINLVMIAESSMTALERWSTVRQQVQSITDRMQKNFRLPPNTHGIAIDDSKIQRKLLSKLMEFMGIAKDNITILGDGPSEILSFEDHVVEYMQLHACHYVLLIADEQLDIVNESSQHETISGSHMIKKIRERLPPELEGRMLTLVRSANDSAVDIGAYRERAHGFLPKAPIRRDNVHGTLMPLWVQRFPDGAFYADDDQSVVTSVHSDKGELACNPEDIAQKLDDIDSMFQRDLHKMNWRAINDQIQLLKGDMLTLDASASMMPILGMINLLLYSKDGDSEKAQRQWHEIQNSIKQSLNTGKEMTSRKRSRRASLNFG